MTIAPAKQAAALRSTIWGPCLVNAAGVIPNASTKLWAVSGGAVVITRVHVVVTTVFTAVATTFSMGCFVANVDQAASLYNATAVTSKQVGDVLDSTLAAITAGAPAFTGGVIATPGNIDWVASRVDTGQVQVYLSYYPLDDSATVG